MFDEKWDIRFLELTKHVATWSKDPSTQCGAVIVRPDKTVASIGYNGFPKGCSDEAELYNNRDLKYSRIIHAEVNAIHHATEKLNGYTMYTWPGNISPSCDRCATSIIQSGITTIVHLYNPQSGFADRWQVACDRALQMYDEANVTIKKYVLVNGKYYNRFKVEHGELYILDNKKWMLAK